MNRRPTPVVQGTSVSVAPPVLDAHLGHSERKCGALACDYADDAAFILPGNVAQGRTNVEAAFASFFGLAGGNIQITVTTLTIADKFCAARIFSDEQSRHGHRWRRFFVVRNGLIVGQTAHFGDFLIQ
jgi:hypothetical protein